jgi:hypothetical protein
MLLDGIIPDVISREAEAASSPNLGSLEKKGVS